MNATCSPMQSMACSSSHVCCAHEPTTIVRRCKKSAKPKKIAVRVMEKAMPIKRYRGCHLERVNKGPERTDYSDGGRVFSAVLLRAFPPVAPARGPCEPLPTGIPRPILFHDSTPSNKLPNYQPGDAKGADKLEACRTWEGTYVDGGQKRRTFFSFPSSQPEDSCPAGGFNARI